LVLAAEIDAGIGMCGTLRQAKSPWALTLPPSDLRDCSFANVCIYKAWAITAAVLLPIVL